MEMADQGLVMGSNEGWLFIFLLDDWMLFQWEGRMILEGTFYLLLGCPKDDFWSLPSPDVNQCICILVMLCILWHLWLLRD